MVTVDRLEQLIAAGAFAKEQRVELIDGQLVDRPRFSNLGHACVSRLLRILASLGGSGRAQVHVHGAIRIDDLSLLGPAVALLRSRDDFYASSRPRPADVLLVIEVADTSLRFDRTVKVPMYARAGVAEAWVVDLNGGVVDVATGATADGYERVEQLDGADTLAPVAFPDLKISVRDVLGQPEA